MFDFSIWEVAVVGGVGLVVLGPQRLPAVARALGSGVRKFQQFSVWIKSEIAEQLKQQQLQENEAKAAAAEQHRE